MLGIHRIASRISVRFSLLVILVIGMCASAQALELSGVDKTANFEAEVTREPIVLQWACTYIYPADVNQRTYHITVPGKYCLAGDLNATVYTAGTLSPYGSVSSTSTFEYPAIVKQPAPAHTGSAIHVHVSNVEIDFRGFSLVEQKSGTVPAGIRIEFGISNISIHGGSVTGFENGIGTYASVAGSYPSVSKISIRDMEFSGSEVGLALIHVVDSVISQNSFAGEVMGFGLSTATDVRVTQNHFYLPSNNTWAAGLYTSWGAYDLLIADNTFYGNGSRYKMGIHLHNHSHRATPEQVSRNNRVERNVLYNLEDPIYVGGTGVASGNIVKDNQIYGNYPEYISKLYPTGFPEQFTAIQVDNNVDVEIIANYIFSGWSRPYYNGIELTGATTIKPDANGDPMLRYNSTCGVFDSLVPPPGVAESSVDGGNYWNFFCEPPQID